jgi:tRNA-dihydrouridine synthase C
MCYYTRNFDFRNCDIIENRFPIRNLRYFRANMNQHPYLEPLPLSGNKTLPHAVLPGPLEGLMSPLFVGVAGEMGLTDTWMTPFLRISTAIPGVRPIRKFFAPFLDSGIPVIGQLLGKDPHLIAGTAERIIATLPLLGINLNFACPSRTVIANRGGGYLLREPDRIVRIIAEIRARCPSVSISVKLRSGMESPSEMETVIPAVASAGVDFIVLHFRTVAEMYRPVPDGIDRIAKAVLLAKPVPLIASGDLFCIDDALNMHAQSGCRGITVARGLLRNPFLIRRILSHLISDGSEPFSEEDSAIDADRSKLLDALQEKIRSDPKRFDHGSHILELARTIWGEDDPRFRNMLNR